MYDLVCRTVLCHVSVYEGEVSLHRSSRNQKPRKTSLFSSKKIRERLLLMHSISMLSKKKKKKILRLWKRHSGDFNVMLKSSSMIVLVPPHQAIISRTRIFISPLLIYELNFVPYDIK
jgi:hypothetical protein